VKLYCSPEHSTLNCKSKTLAMCAVHLPTS